MQGRRYLILGVAFVVELAALVAVAVVGLTLDASLAVRLLVGVGGPLVMAGLWGLYAAPKARRPLTGLRGAVFKACFFVVAAVALGVTGREGWGVALLAVYLANAAALRLTEPAPAGSDLP